MSDVNADIHDLGGDADTHFQQAGNTSAEVEAREQGWVPQDEWQGNPADWRSADEFLERGKQVTAIMRKKLQGKDREIAELKRLVADSSTTVGELRDYIANVEQKAFDRAVATLKAQRKEALANGDFAGAADMEEQIDTLKEARSSVPEVKKPAADAGAGGAAAPNQVHPDVAQWMQRNPWFHESNQDAVDFANGRALSIANRRAKAGEQVVPSDVLEEVTRDVQRRFPELFEGQPAMFSSSNAGGGTPRSGTNSTSRGKGFNSLPAEAKAQFQRFYDQGFYTVKGDKGKKLPLAEAQAEYFRNYE